jgi:hypothetical protein
MTVEYDRADAINVRSYTDAFYAKNAALITGKLIPRPIHRWRDYRSTVLAFLKADADPRTPDQSRGVSSIQVTFRDWISPWITLDYLPKLDLRVTDIRGRLGTKVTGDYRESVDLIIEDVKVILAGRGLIGKQREYNAIKSALDALAVTNPPDFLPVLTKTVQSAISVQQTQDYMQAATIGGVEDEAAFEILTEAIVRSDIGNDIVRGELTGVIGNIDKFTADLVGVQAAVNSFDGRLDATLAEGGELQRFRSDLEFVTQQVNVLQNLDVQDVQTKMVEVVGLGNRLQALELQFRG